MVQLSATPTNACRVAVIADVHGNTPALEAVLEEVRKSDADVLVNLGCLTHGPDPTGVVRLLRGVDVPTLSVQPSTSSARHGLPII